MKIFVFLYHTIINRYAMYSNIHRVCIFLAHNYIDMHIMPDYVSAYAEYVENARVNLNGYNVSLSQSVSLDSNLKNEILQISAASIPSWGLFLSTHVHTCLHLGKTPYLLPPYQILLSHPLSKG